MGMISAIFDRSAYSFEEAFGTPDCTSVYMKDAIREWFSLYFETAPTDEADPCMRIPYTVVNKLVKTVFGEYTAASKDATSAACVVTVIVRNDHAIQTGNALRQQRFRRQISRTGVAVTTAINHIGLSLGLKQNTLSLPHIKQRHSGIVQQRLCP